jgi:hypothetical protein
MKKRLLPFAAALIVLTFGMAHALVLESGSPEQKFRKDVGKQLSKYALCLIKQLRLCENTGASSGPECLLSPVVQATPPADAKLKFVAGVALCESKVDLSKKSPSGGTDPIADYESIGCPGDSDGGTSGDQRYADLNAYQAGTIATLKTTLQANAALIDVVGCAPGSNHMDEADIDCVAAEAQKVATLVKGIFKCGAKCENDYKNLFGNGGGTDDPVCADGGDANFQICLDAAIAKATKKGPFDPGVQTYVDGTLAPALTGAGDDIYNQDDCGP